MKTDSIPVKILIVDDREDNHMSLETIWSDEDYTFVHALSGKEALRILLNDTDFTLIIMDVMMPEMDGFETASYIARRSKLKDIPILFLTARGTEGQVFKAFNVGAVDYISKPVIPELLRAKVNVFIELSHKNQTLESQKQKLKLANTALEVEIKEKKASEKKVKALNQQLSKKLKELEALDAFTYSVAHDLRNPLTNISIITQVLQSNDVVGNDKQATELVEKIENQVTKVNNLINDLLLFSHQEDDIVKEEVDMNKVVLDVIEDMKLTYRLNGQYEVIVDDLPVVKCNPTLIKQVWSNLISNAIKYSREKDKPIVRIEVATNESYPVFSVSDNGIGFDPKESDSLFKVFKRLDSAKKFEGSGVGLAIVKRIIDKHGGSIWAKSKPGQGTTFSFYV